MIHVDKYERYWLIVIIIVLSIFFASLIAGLVIYGVRLPSTFESNKYNPAELNTLPGFSNPGPRVVGVTEDGNPKYDLYIIARKWRYDVGTEYNLGTTQNPILEFPQGAEVTIYVASEDTTHGFLIERHNVNAELVPGEIARMNVTFDRVGEYGVVCHEFCGVSHQNMWMTFRIVPTDEFQAAGSDAEVTPEVEATVEATPEVESIVETTPEAEMTAEATPEVESTAESTPEASS